MTDWLEASTELLRAIRGRRSQVAFSRRLGYRTNVCADWEGGYRMPASARFLDACSRAGLDVEAAFLSFHPPAAPAFEIGEPSAWLRALRGATPISDLQERTAFSAPQLRRWLAGRADPRLPQWLALVEALTGRAGDWVAGLVDIHEVPTLLGRYQAGRAQRRLAFEHPWTPAVRILLSRPLPASDASATIARLLGQPEAEMRIALGQLLDTGLVAERKGMLEAVGELTVDLRASREDRRGLRQHWSAAATSRLAQEHKNDLFSYSLMAVSRDDLEKIRTLQRRFFREIRGIASASEPSEVAALVVSHVIQFDGE